MGNIHKLFAHLTNYSLNKRSEGFVHGGSQGERTASKRTLATVLQQLEEAYPGRFSTQAFWQQVPLLGGPFAGGSSAPQSRLPTHVFNSAVALCFLSQMTAQRNPPAPAAPFGLGSAAVGTDIPRSAPPPPPPLHTHYRADRPHGRGTSQPKNHSITMLQCTQGDIRYWSEMR